MALAPSNGVDPAAATGLALPITIDGNTTFNGDTGRINGAFSRQQGEGISDGIGYARTTFLGADLAVFSLRSLDVTSTGSL